MTIYDRNIVLKQIIAKFGEDQQIEMIIEECSELIQALQKLKRAKTNHAGESDLIEKRLHEVRSEVADVKIMIGQAVMIFGRNEIDDIIDAKLERIKVKL